MSLSFISADTEDDSRERMESTGSGFGKRVTQIAAMSTERRPFYSRGAETRPFKNWLRSGAERFVYCHNTQYDLGNLFSKQLDALDMTLVGGRFIKARWGAIEFRDTFNLWPMSLKQIGKAFGLAKGELDERSRDYVMRDTQITHAAVSFVSRFCKKLGIVRLPNTLGGLAVAVWEQTAGRKEACFDSDELSRAALYGGRVELFKAHSESERVVYVDLNSLYPFCMTGEFPGPMVPWEPGRVPRWGIVEASVRVPRGDLPVLPWRRADGAILFPCGRFRGTWAGEELLFAMSRGTRVERIHRAIGSHETLQPYGEFCHQCYGYRQSARTKPERLLWKLCLNNLYGRLASTGRITRSVKLTERTIVQGHPFGGKVLVEYEMPLQNFVNWSHAAHVTARGRILLARYLDKIGSQNLIYCDTDSAIFDWPPGKPLPFELGTAMGEMKLVGEENGAVTYAPKAYRFGKQWKAKGVPQRLAEDFLRDGKASFDLPFRLREAIMFFDRDNARELSVWHRVTRERRAPYDKKRLTGNRYFPKRICAP